VKIKIIKIKIFYVYGFKGYFSYFGSFLMLDFYNEYPA